MKRLKTRLRKRSRPCQPRSNITPKPYYITLPKSYASDVDRGHLNQRAWVLQERVLAPRTIHFTKDHIYLENEDDVLGEDGIPKRLSGRSCIDKYGDTRSTLLPKGKLFHGSYNALDSGSDSWLRLMEMYSECKITYTTDRLMAIAGLVRYKATHGESIYQNFRNIVGSWEPTLHSDLLWVSRPGKPTFLDSLMLPSWTWLAYEGPVSFVQDRRSSREGEPARGVVSEIQLVASDVPENPERLPHAEVASISLRASLLNTLRIGAKAQDQFRHGSLSRQELIKHSPFSHDPRTHTSPIWLTRLSDCFEIYNHNGRMIGFLSLDTRDEVPPGNLYCLHIATLHDQASIFKVSEADRCKQDEPASDWAAQRSAAHTDTSEEPKIKDSRHKSLSADFGVDTQLSTRHRHSEPWPPILAYALVVQQTGKPPDKYRRVGIAQVNYDWISQGLKSTVMLV